MPTEPTAPEEFPADREKSRLAVAGDAAVTSPESFGVARQSALMVGGQELTPDEAWHGECSWPSITTKFEGINDYRNSDCRPVSQRDH